MIEFCIYFEDKHEIFGEKWNAKYVRKKKKIRFQPITKVMWKFQSDVLSVKYINTYGWACECCMFLQLYSEREEYIDTDVHFR